MTPEYKIKKTILLQIKEEFKGNPGDFPNGVCFNLENESNIDNLWDLLDEKSYIQDYRNEFRRGQEETKFDCGFNRNYEMKSVAAKMFDGSWVGWTYWYGGGKHAEPEAIDWINYSYDLDCEEKEITVIQKTFTKSPHGETDITGIS